MIPYCIVCCAYIAVIQDVVFCCFLIVFVNVNVCVIDVNVNVFFERKYCFFSQMFCCNFVGFLFILTNNNQIMKKFIVLYLFTVSFIALHSCDGGNSLTLETDQEVRLRASVIDGEGLGVRSLGPITSQFSIDFPIGVFAHSGTWLAGPNANIINNDAAIVSGANPHNIRFGNGLYYYPSDGSDVTFFAFAPQGKVVREAAVDKSPIVEIPITGKDDVMWATAKGRKFGSAPVEAPILTFAHKLTQLQFAFKSAPSGYPEAGNRVVSLKVEKQPTTLNMNVETGEYTALGSADMEALSQENGASGIEITAAGNNAKSPVMTVPTAATEPYKITLLVKPANSEVLIPYQVSVIVGAEMGKSHMITLVFYGTTVSATTLVTDWIIGGEKTVVVR